MTSSKISDKKRVREVLGETVSSKARDFIYSGDEFAAIRCLAYTSAASVFNDMVEGIGSYTVQSRIYSDFDRSFPGLKARLSSLYEKVFDKSRLTLSVCASEPALRRLDPLVRTLADSLPANGSFTGRRSLEPYGVQNEAFATASTVQYVAFSSPLRIGDRRRDGLSLLLSRTVTGEILYPEIRVKGGAYGAYCSCVSDSSRVLMTSYRDPDLAGTVGVYSSVYERLKHLPLDEEKLWGLVIGTFSRIDRPLSVYQKTCRSTACFMTGKTLDDLRAERESVLSVTPDSFLKAAGRFSGLESDHSVCVIGNKSKIESCRDLFGSVNDLSL